MFKTLDFLSTLNWKLFFVTLGLTFLMAFLPKMGIKITSMVTPAVKKIDVMELVAPKLRVKTDDFAIKKSASLVPTTYVAGELEQTSSFGVIDFDSGQVLLEKNFSERLPIASLTKLMTAMVVLDLASPDKQFKVSEEAAKVEPTRMGVIPGQGWSVKELLTGLLLTSANDSAQVLEEGINSKYGGNVFVPAMNAKAEGLGLKNTHFENPQGLDGQNQYSSVEDLIKLTHYGLTQYPLINEIVQKDYQFLPASSSHKQADLYNWNGLLRVYPGVLGVKIGNTEAAGYTTVVLSKREDKKLLAVLLGAPGVLERDMWAAKLLDLGFEKLGLPAAGITQDQLKEKYATWKYYDK